MNNQSGKGKLLRSIVLVVLLFALFLKLDSIFSLMNTLAEKDWALPPIIITAVLIRMGLAGVVVIILMPRILGFQRGLAWLAESLRISLRGLLLGFLSFLLFGMLAAAISLGMGIFRGDLSVVFATPDIRPDPDVVGWGYFLLALIPGIWEELAFRGLIQTSVRRAFSTTTSILVSSLFFALYHLSNIVTQPPSQVVLGVIMAFFFGLGWGYMTVRARSVVPAIVSHYLVDSMGQIFLNVDGTNPALTTGFFVFLTLLFPIFNIVVAKMMFKKPQLESKSSISYSR